MEDKSPFPVKVANSLRHQAHANNWSRNGEPLPEKAMDRATVNKTVGLTPMRRPETGDLKTLHPSGKIWVLQLYLKPGSLLPSRAWRAAKRKALAQRQRLRGDSDWVADLVQRKLIRDNAEPAIWRLFALAKKSRRLLFHQRFEAEHGTKGASSDMAEGLGFGKRLTFKKTKELWVGILQEFYAFARKEYFAQVRDWADREHAARQQRRRTRRRRHDGFGFT